MIQKINLNTHGEVNQKGKKTDVEDKKMARKESKVFETGPIIGKGECMPCCK